MYEISFKSTLLSNINNKDDKSSFFLDLVYFCHQANLN